MVTQIGSQSEPVFSFGRSVFQFDTPDIIHLKIIFIYQGSGCWGAVDTPLYHRMDIGDSASGLAGQGGGPPL